MSKLNVAGNFNRNGNYALAKSTPLVKLLPALGQVSCATAREVYRDVAHNRASTGTWKPEFRLEILRGLSEPILACISDSRYDTDDLVEVVGSFAFNPVVSTEQILEASKKIKSCTHVHYLFAAALLGEGSAKTSDQDFRKSLLDGLKTTFLICFDSASRKTLLDVNHSSVEKLSKGCDLSTKMVSFIDKSQYPEIYDRVMVKLRSCIMGNPTNIAPILNSINEIAGGETE